MAGYSAPVGGITRRLNSSTVIHSTNFKRGSYFNFGARTAVINIPDTNKLVIWNSIPPGRELSKAIDLATDNESNKYEVVAGIVPDIEHTLAAQELKRLYPNIFLIGPSGIKDKPSLKLDYTFEDSVANRVIEGKSILRDLEDFQFVFLNGHQNRELLTFDKATDTLFEADLLFNIPWSGANHDQYLDKNQNAGFSFLTGFLNPDSIIGGFFLRLLIPFKNDENRLGLKTVFEELDFETIVPAHGEVIEKDAKKAFKKVFGSYF